MNWPQYVEWTDETALPSNDSWEALRAGLIEECHEALAVWHQIKALEYGAIKRQHRDGPPPADVLALRESFLQGLNRRLVEEVGDACWYAARICRLNRGRIYEPRCVHSDLVRLMHRLEAKTMAGYSGRIDWAVSLLTTLLSAMGVSLDAAIANNTAKLTARKAAGTIQGEGER